MVAISVVGLVAVVAVPTVPTRGVPAFASTTSFARRSFCHVFQFAPLHASRRVCDIPLVKEPRHSETDGGFHFLRHWEATHHKLGVTAAIANGARLPVTGNLDRLILIVRVGEVHRVLEAQVVDRLPFNFEHAAPRLSSIDRRPNLCRFPGAGSLQREDGKVACTRSGRACERRGRVHHLRISLPGTALVHREEEDDSICFLHRGRSGEAQQSTLTAVIPCSLPLLPTPLLLPPPPTFRSDIFNLCQPLHRLKSHARCLLQQPDSKDL